MDEQKYANFENGLSQAVLDVLVGRAPAVVVYPKTWKSKQAANAREPILNVWRSFMTSTSLITAGVFAANSYHLFDAAGPLSRGEIPFDTLPLAVLPFSIQLVSNKVESFIAFSKNVKMIDFLLPSYSLPLIGARSVYETIPRNKNDLFDITAAGFGSGIALSLLAFYSGIQLQLSSSSELISTFPTVPLSLIQANTIVWETISTIFPASALLPADSDVHLHYLIIAGAMSFFASCLQLLPFDVSTPGGRLSYCFFNAENYAVVLVLSNIFKVIFLVLSIFNFKLNPASRSRLIVDFILASQLGGTPSVSDCCKFDV